MSGFREREDREGTRRRFLRAMLDHAPQVLEDLRRLLPRHRLIFVRLIPADMTSEEYTVSLRRKGTRLSGVLLHELAVEEMVVTGVKPRKPPASRGSRYIFKLQAQPESLLWLHGELSAWAQRHHLVTEDRWFVRQALYQLDDWRCTKTPVRGNWGDAALEVGGETAAFHDADHVVWLIEYQLNAVRVAALAARFGREPAAMADALRQLADVMGLALRRDAAITPC